MRNVSIGSSGAIAVSLSAIGLAASVLQAGTCTSQPSNLPETLTVVKSDGVNERAADNIALTNSDVISGFCWNGLYALDPLTSTGDCSDTAVDNFTIRVYEAAPEGSAQCLPATLLRTYTQGAGPANITVTRTVVGDILPGLPELHWEAAINNPNDNPLLLNAGTCVWIEITAPDQAGTCTFWLALSDNTAKFGDGNSLVDITTGTAYAQEDLLASDLAVGVTTVLGEGLIENADLCNLTQCIIPTNDACSDFIPLSGNVVDLPFFNFNATNDGPLVPGDCPGQQSTGDPAAIGADIWYLWTPTVSGPAEISLCGSNYDGVLVVYSNNTCPASTIVACDDDGCGGGGPSFVILENVVANDPMLIRVGGWQSATTLTGVLNISSGGPGACCFIAQGGCEQATEADGSDCAAAGGLYQGVGTLCDSIECPGSVCTAEADDPAQLPIPTQGGATSSHVFTISDDFVLNAADTVTGVCVWGGHRIGTTATDCGADPGGGSPNTWRIRIYGTTVVDGTPIPNTAAILSETTVNDPPRVATGNMLTDNPIAEYSYHITLAQPFAATANTCYWLEVRAPEDLTVPLGTGCRFRWETSNTGDGVAFQPANPDVNGYAPGDGVALDMSWVLETTGSAGIGNLLICTPAPVPLVCEGGFDTLTESTAGNITAGGISCGNPSFTQSFARSMNVGAAPFEVCNVQFAASNSGSATNTTVNLYSDIDGGVPLQADLTLLGTTSIEIPNSGNALFTATFNPPICVPANTQLVVEWAMDFGAGQHDGFIAFAANALGQNSATYILSEACGATEFTDLTEFGFPDAHWVLAVCGNAGKCDGVCEGGKDTCPADIAPAAGGDCNADGNGTVDAADLGQLLANWGNPVNDCADIAPPGSPNGVVDAADLGQLLANWGQCG
jgi:hypothetical protein